MLAFIFSDRAMGVFSADPEVIAAGIAALRALSLALPFWALWFVSGGSLRGSGDTRTPMFIGASTMWLSVLLAWIFVRWFGGGLGLVWLAFVLTTSPASILLGVGIHPSDQGLRARSARAARRQCSRQPLTRSTRSYAGHGGWFPAPSPLHRTGRGGPCGGDRY